MAYLTQLNVTEELKNNNFLGTENKSIVGHISVRKEDINEVTRILYKR